jgi:hypothetical protein
MKMAKEKMAKEKMAKENTGGIEPLETAKDTPDTKKKPEAAKVLPLTDTERTEMNSIASRMNNGRTPPSPDEILRLSRLRSRDKATKE